MSGQRRLAHRKSLKRRFPILEFDASRRAIIEPRKSVKRVAVPRHCVVCFFREVIDALRTAPGTREVARIKSEAGEEPLLEIKFRGKRLAAFHPGVGAPLAAAFLEEVIARGCRKFIACGSAGVLDKGIAGGHIIVPTGAVRDEGVSYHYLPAAREVKASARGVAAICEALARHGIPFTKGKTWTTDAYYRETLAKIALRRSEGCIAVEMEAAAFFAVAKFRNVTFAQMLYGGDDVSGIEWDPRGWDRKLSVRERLLRLAAEACLLL